MVKDLFFVFWFFAPVGLANEAAWVSGKIPFINKFSFPVDFYAKYRKKRVLGNHKTIRGFLFGILAGIIAVYIQIYLYQHIAYLRQIIPLNYNSINPIIFGTLSGFGAIIGDSVKSFFKRQIGIQPGNSWFPFDQIDYTLGGIIFTSFYIRLSLYHYVLLFLLWFILHPLFNLIGYLLKLKDKPL